MGTPEDLSDAALREHVINAQMFAERLALDVQLAATGSIRLNTAEVLTTLTGHVHTLSVAVARLLADREQSR